MSKLDFEKLKDFFNKKSSLLAPPFFMLNYAEKIDRFCLCDQNNLILSYDEFKTLVDEIEKFYQSVSDQDIVDTNNYILSSRSAQTKVETIESKKIKRHVYLIEKCNGDCKIGVTSNLNARLSQIRTIEPQARILHEFSADDAYKAEEIMHHVFRDQNIGGEWFRLSEQDIENIRSITEYKESQFLRSKK